MVSELFREFRQVVIGRASIIDGVIPPAVFALVGRESSVGTAAAAALGTGLAIVVFRLARGKSLKFATLGLVGVVVASAAALIAGPDGFFLPAVVSGFATALVIVGSIAARKPFVAWTSWLARSWPLNWYWHPQVRPAYTFVSWIWAAFFAARAAGQWATLDDTTAAATYRVLAGWPALIVLLIATYVVGRKRLDGLAGPSVAEFEDGSPPPWQGQRTGF